MPARIEGNFNRRSCALPKTKRPNNGTTCLAVTAQVGCNLTLL